MFPIDFSVLIHHLLPFVSNDDFFLTLPSLNKEWKLMLATRIVQSSCRERFRMYDAQYQVFAKQAWPRLDPSDVPRRLTEKNWWRECYSLFKIIHQMELQSFGIISRTFQLDDASRRHPRFHLPQAFQAYVIDFWSAQQLCGVLQDEKCIPTDDDVNRFCPNCWGNFEWPSLVSPYLAVIPLPGVYHVSYVAIWLGSVPTVCNEATRAAIDQLLSYSQSTDQTIDQTKNQTIDSTINLTINQTINQTISSISQPTPVTYLDDLANLDFNPVFKGYDENSMLRIASLSARDYFLYSPMARHLDTEWDCNFEEMAVRFSQSDYDARRLASLSPVALKAAVVMQSWFDAFMDIFPWNMFECIFFRGGCDVADAHVDHIMLECSLFDKWVGETVRTELTHPMSPNNDVSPNHSMELWLHNMMFWEERGKRLARVYFPDPKIRGLPSEVSLR